MPSNSMSVVVQRLRSAAGRDGAGQTDGELLTQFLNRRDEDALAALVERHAPMVWGVCQRILRNPHDAEDAFQASFLLLVQKAASVLPREMVANWLYGVARQTAVRLRTTRAKRGWREVQMDIMPEPAVAETRDEELLSLLDEELSRLPERHRALIVFCDLEVRTRKEAAHQLGCPEGTVASGLARARELLAKRLSRRGLAVSGASLAATLSHSMASADVPVSVVTSTTHLATLFAAGNALGVISAAVVTLTQGVLKTMFLKKILTATMAVLVLGVAVITGGSLAVGQSEGKPVVGKEVKPPVAEKPDEQLVKAPVPRGGAENKDQEQIQGLWQAESLEAKGEKAPDAVATKFQLRFQGDKITFVAEGRTHSFELLSDAKPRGMNLTPGDGAAKGKKLECAIYELDGDKLTICIDKEVKLGKRPTEFKTAPGDGLVLLVFKRVKEDKKEDPMQEPFTAWGEEVNGIQAGLGFKAGERRAYHHGESVTLVVRVRNVGKETVTFDYLGKFFVEHPHKVTDAKGQAVPVESVTTLGLHIPQQVKLEPGKEITLREQAVELRQPKKEAQNYFNVFHGTGRFHLSFDPVLGNTSSGKIKLDPALAKLATGKLELEVKEQEKQEPFTAWGKEVDGLQLGASLVPDNRSEFQQGEKMELEIKLRNVGKLDSTVTYGMYDSTPTVTDAKGGKVLVAMPPFLGIYATPTQKRLKVGETAVILKLTVSIREVQTAEQKENGHIGPPTIRVAAGKYKIAFSKSVGHSEMSFTSIVPIPFLTTGEVEFEVKNPDPVADPKPKTEPFTLKNVTIDEVDEKAGVISVSFGNKDKATKLVNVPLDKAVRVVASHVFPGVANHFPFEWKQVERLKGKVVSLRLTPSADGLAIVSIAAGND